MNVTKIRSVLAVIFDETEEKILLIKRRDVPVWVLPGGGVEDLETPEEAILREVKEETNMEVTLLRKVGLYHPPKGGLFQKPTLLYACKCITSSDASSTEEVKEGRFFPIHALPRQIPPPFLEFIEDTLKNNPSFEKTITSVTLAKVLFHFSMHPVLAARFLLSRIGLHWNSYD